MRISDYNLFRDHRRCCYRVSDIDRGDDSNEPITTVLME
jgi:hypothetical protein